MHFRKTKCPIISTKNLSALRLAFQLATLGYNDKLKNNIILPNFYDVILNFGYAVELVSKELNHFGVIAGLFRQIGGHSSIFVLFCSFWRLFTIKMIKSVKVFPFSF